MNKLSYRDVYDVIQLYAGSVLPMYADGWERFPCGQYARLVVEKLRDEARFWSGRKDDVERRITEAADEVEYRANS